MRSFKQYVKEKVAKTNQKTEDTDQYRAFRKEFHELEDYLEKSIKITRNFCQKFERTTKIQESMGDYLKECGLQAGEEMGELMLKVGELLKSLGTIHHAMAINLVEKYIQPSMKFQASMKSVDVSHKKYQKKRLETDAQVNFCRALSAKDPAKVDQDRLRNEKEKLKQMESERDEAFDESCEGHVDLLVKRRTVHMNEFCEIVNSFHHFYAEGYTLTHNMMEYLETMKAKCKQNAEALQKAPIDRVRTFDPETAASSPSARNSLSSCSTPRPVSSDTSSSFSPSTAPSVSTNSASSLSSASLNLKAIALYDYAPDQDNELAFSSGDKIIVTKQHDSDGWWEGYLEKKPSKVGVFPSNHVKLQDASNDGSGDNNLSTALYDYEATDEGELSFHAGDNITILERLEGGWWKGKLQSNGLIGLYPSNFTDVQ
jgi:hypothetical protein